MMFADTSARQNSVHLLTIKCERTRDLSHVNRLSVG